MEKVLVIDKDTGGVIDLIALPEEYVQETAIYPNKIGFSNPTKQKFVTDEGMDHMVVEHGYDINNFVHAVVGKNDLDKTQELIKSRMDQIEEEMEKLKVINELLEAE